MGTLPTPAIAYEAYLKVKRLDRRYASGRRFANLLGYKHWRQMNAGFNEEDEQYCRQLLGENGKFIFQILKARHVNK